MAYEQPTLARMNGRSASGGSPSNQGAVQRRIDAAIRAVLGRVPRVDDPQAFLTAINQFAAQQSVDGHPDIDATIVGDDRTVAEGRLQQRLQEAQQVVPPLLARLQPLKANPDTKKVEIARRLAQASFDELIDEVRGNDEPNVDRIDDLFARLEAALTQLDNAFGIENGEINIVEDRQQQADFRTIRDDYVKTLKERWNDVKQGADYDAQVARLRRTFGIMAELVPEVEQAMDDACLGRAQRDIGLVGDPPTSGTDTRPTINDVLEWISRLASSEGPRLLREGGKSGITALVQPLITLRNFAGKLKTKAEQDKKDEHIPEDSCLPQALSRLEQQLERALTTAQTATTTMAMIEEAQLTAPVLAHFTPGRTGPTASGKVRFANLTDPNTVPTNHEVEFGFGTPHTDPETWTWKPSTGYKGLGSGEFEYTAQLSPPAGDIVYVLMRCRLDKNQSWFYGQVGGSTRGQSLEQQTCDKGILIMDQSSVSSQSTKKP